MTEKDDGGGKDDVFRRAASRKSKEEDRVRQRQNIAVAIGVLVLGGLLYWFVVMLANYQATERCVEERRRNCFDLGLNPPAQ